MTADQQQATNLKPWEGFAILELFGRVRLVGFLTEQVIAGGAFVRIDVPEVDGHPKETHFYGASAVYAVHPTTEVVVRALVRDNRPEPVSVYEIRAIAPPRRSDDEEAY